MSIEKIRNIGLDKLVTQVYDFDSLTTDELMCKFAQKINIIIEHFNYLDDRCQNNDKAMEEKLQYLLNEGLEEQVAKRLIELVNDGTIADLINVTVFKNIDDRLNSITNKGLDGYIRFVANTMYGIKGDFDPITGEGTDDSVAIQNAINKISENGGGTLYLPSGNFKINSRIIWKTKVSLVGMGRFETMLYPTFNTGSPIHYDINWTLGHPENWHENCNFKDYGINGELVKLDDYNVAVKGIFIQKLKNCEFRNLYIANICASGLGIDFLQNCVVDNVIAQNCGRVGNKDSDGASGIGIGTNGDLDENCSITNCFTKGCGKFGIFIEGQMGSTGLGSNSSKGITISNVITKENSFGIGVFACNYVTISNVQAYENLYHGLKMYNSNHIQFDNCIFSENEYTGITLDSRTCTDITFSNSKIFNNKKQGIRIYAPVEYEMKDIDIIDCKIFGNVGNGLLLESNGNIENVNIIDTKITDNGKNGASVPAILLIGTGTMSKLFVKGSTINGQYQSYGIHSKIVGDTLQLVNCNLSGNSVAVLNMESDWTNKTLFNNLPVLFDKQNKKVETATLQSFDTTGYETIIYKNTDTQETVNRFEGGDNYQRIVVIVANTSFKLITGGNIKLGGTLEELDVVQGRAIEFMKYNYNWYIVSKN